MEVSVLPERDRLLGDPLHARRRVGDLDLLGSFVPLPSSDAARVQQIRLDRMRREEVQETISLESVGEGEERIRPGHPKELALLRRATRGGSRCLAQHEEGGRLLRREPGDRGDDVLVPIEDEQEVRLLDLVC
jgi:hypothetical protein